MPIVDDVRDHAVDHALKILSHHVIHALALSVARPTPGLAHGRHLHGFAGPRRCLHRRQRFSVTARCQLEWMSADRRAQDLLFVCDALGQAARVVAFGLERFEEARLPGGPSTLEPFERALGVDQAGEGVHPRQVLGLDRPRIDARQEVIERAERPAAFDARDRASGQFTHLVEPHVQRRRLMVHHHRELMPAVIDVRWPQGQAEPARFGEIHALRIVAAPVGEDGGHEQRRVMRLAPGRSPCRHRVRGGMCFREAIAGESRHHVPDPQADVGRNLRHNLGPRDETIAQRAHLLAGVEVAHGAAQQISVRQRQPGEFVRDAQDLLLVQDHAERLVEQRRQRGMDVFDRLAAQVSPHVGVAQPALDRARPKERQRRQHVVDAAGLQVAQGVAHAARLDLEAADRAARADQLRRVGVDVRDRIEPGDHRRDRSAG